MASLPEALRLAREAFDAGALAQAEAIYQQILAVVPAEPYALNGLGELALVGGRWDEAADYVTRAIAQVSSQPAFFNNLYEIRRLQGRLDEAADCCQQAIALAPGYPQLHSNLGVVRRQQGQPEQAVASFRRAVELDPRLAVGHYNLGNAYVELEQFDAADASFRRALELIPDHPDFHLNLANSLQAQGRNAESLEHFEEAIRLRPDSADAHQGRSAILLLLGRLDEGWREYEWRWKTTGAYALVADEHLWRGEPLAGRTVVLVAEQGFGDVLQFIRYAQVLSDHGARVIVACSPALHPLLARTPGIGSLMALTRTKVDADYFVPMMNVPSKLGTTLATIPASIPYIFADDGLIERWRQRLGAYDGCKVGIVWQGSASASRGRSIGLEHFTPLADVPGVRLISLQKGYGSEQLVTFSRRASVLDFTDEIDVAGGAFMDTAAIMKNLDLVITCDTSSGHLAGALGVDTWTLLHEVPEWRWMLERTDTPWYPTVRLFRQQRRGEWAELFARVAEELRRFAAARA